MNGAVTQMDDGVEDTGRLEVERACRNGAEEEASREKQLMSAKHGI